VGNGTDVFIVGASDRMHAVGTILGEFDLSVFAGSTVTIKANYNSADPYPASTRSLLEQFSRKNPSG
jgi:uncharacterized protein (DUF362 family)